MALPRGATLAKLRTITQAVPKLVRPSAWTLLRAMQSAWGRAAACARDVARSLWEVVRIRTFIVIVLQARRFSLC